MKHIKANFVFIKDRVDDEEMPVIDCPTEVLRKCGYSKAWHSSK